jgi:hypothetical protein
VLYQKTAGKMNIRLSCLSQIKKQEGNHCVFTGKAAFADKNSVFAERTAFFA